MKLSKIEKQWLRDMKATYKGNLTISLYGRVTFAMTKTGPNRGKIAWAIYGEYEKKFSKKRGQFEAVGRLYHDISLPIECDFEDEEYIEQRLDELAYNLT